MIQTTFVRILPLTLLALLVLPLSGLAAFGAQAPAAPIPITYGQDVTLTTMNFHESLFEDDPDHPGLPWPAQREATATGNMARAALTAGLDEAGVAIARVGVEYDILPGPHNWDDIKDEPVVVTVQFTYTLAADWATGAGSSNANLAVRPLHAAPGWFDRLGFETGETGSRGDTVTRAYLTTPDLLGDKTLLETYVQAHTASGSVDSTSASEVTVQSIHFDFEPELVDLTFADLEVTQGIQNLANDMPLVEGRHTVVRAYAESNVKDQAGVTAHLRAFRGGSELAGSPLAARNEIAVQTDGGDRVDRDDSFWFFLPADWRWGTVTFRAEINPEGEIVESDTGNNEIERAVTFQDGEDLNVIFVPLRLQNNGNPNNPVQIYYITDPNFPRILAGLRQRHPVASVNWWYFNVPEIPENNNAARWNLSTNAGQNTLLGDLGWKNFWTWDPASDLHYVGMVHPLIGTTVGGGSTLGLGHLPGSEVWVKMESHIAGHPAWYLRGAYTLAHELGHNKGLQHVLCAGTEGNPDPNWPWPAPNCSLATVDADGYYGFDVYYAHAGLAAPTVLSNDPAAAAPNQAFPLMGYRHPTWVSPYEYCLLLPIYGVPCGLNFLAGPADATDLADAGDLADASAYLAASGLVTTSTQTVNLDAVYALDEAPPDAVAQQIERRAGALPAADPYTLVQLDAGGGVLSSHEIQLDAEDGGGTVFSFLELVSFEPGAVKVQVRHGPDVLAERAASASPPTVEVLSPNGGETLAPGATVTWAASDADGDDLTFHVLYSADDGATWRAIGLWLDGDSFEIPSLADLPGSDLGRVRIVANDGFHTAGDDSDGAFSVPGAPPLPLILQPFDGATVAPGSPVFMEGAASDVEDGPLPPAQLAWSSDLDGDLGTGREVLTDTLSFGRHEITLTATDDDGEMAEATITLHVVYRIFLPTIRKE